LIEARRSVQALRPQPLDTASLIDALTTLTHQLTRHSPVKAIVHMCGVPYALLPEVENHLFRIAQESITNVLKHAQGSQIHLTLVYQLLQVQLTVQDNGQGFDPDLISSSSYGMLGMQERAQAIGAVLTFTSQPGQGTMIEVLLPVLPSVGESR
jgi:signal transduction histidine kinase